MKIKKIFICMFCVAVAAAIVIYPEKYVKCCLEGLYMWAECVVPSLFPFAVIAGLLTKTGIAESLSKPFGGLNKRLNMPNFTSVCFAISAVSGYPTGSRTVAEFYGDGALGQKNSLSVASLCSTSGPLFVIGSVGFKMFGDKTVGVKIFIAHVLSVVAVSVILALLSKKGKPSERAHRVKSQNVLYESFYGAVTAVLTAGAFIVFFYTVSNIICDFNLFYPFERLLSLFLPENVASGICKGIIEATGGCLQIAKSNHPLAAPLCGFLITFGGASILLQQLCYLVKVGVKPIYFILIKLLQAVICFLILLFV